MSIEAPIAVQYTEQFLDALSLDNVITMNSGAREVTSCQDAASHRSRLGMGEIALWDEMKTRAYIATIGTGEQIIALAHCRGDRKIDDAALAHELDTQDIREMTKPELLDRLDMSYGLVNPFRSLPESVVNIFDGDLLTPLTVTGTVMTNAGHPQWGVEVWPGQLVDALPNSVLAAISAIDPDEPPRAQWAADPARIGILTGNPTESGALLVKMTNRLVREKLGRYAAGDIVMPEFEMKSRRVLGLTMELSKRHKTVLPALLKATRELCEAEVRLVTVACNTTPYYADEIRTVTDEYGARFVSLPEEVDKRLTREGVEEIDIIAAKTVSDLGPWSAYTPFLRDKKVRVPDDRSSERIDELAYKVKSKGASQNELNPLFSIINNFDDGANVVVALTEMSEILAFRSPKQRKNSRVNIFDALEITAEVLADHYIGPHNWYKVKEKVQKVQ